MPTVSIVTVVKNDCKNIADTMNSVLEQSFQDIEYVIKDGLSQDGTLEIAQCLKRKYVNRRIKLISCKDSGIYDAMNQAVLECSGEWILFLNSGDMFASEEIVSSIFQDCDNNIKEGVLYGDAIVRDEGGDAVWRANIEKIKKEMPFCHQSCFIRRDYLLKYPFDCNYRIAADYNQILELFVNQVPFKNVNMIISIFDLGGFSSTKFITRLSERNSVLSKHGIYHRKKGVIVFEYLEETIKTIMVKVVPSRILFFLKKWYKVHIKHYEICK